MPRVVFCQQTSMVNLMSSEQAMTVQIQISPQPGLSVQLSPLILQDSKVMIHKDADWYL